MKRIFMGMALALTAGCMEQPQNSQTAEFAALATPSESKVPASVSGANNGLSLAEVTAIWPEGAHGSRGVLERLRTGEASAKDVAFARDCIGMTTV